MSEQHTPGPWRANPLDNESEWEIVGPDHVGEDECQYVATVIGGHDPDEETSEANARLIAAAPDLLNAARMQIKANKGNDNEEVSFTAWLAMDEAAAKALAAAIAKATGT